MFNLTFTHWNSLGPFGHFGNWSYDPFYHDTPYFFEGHCLKTNLLLYFGNIYFLLLLSVDYFELMFISVSGSECGQVKATPPLKTRICTVLLLFDSLKILSASECFWMKQVVWIRSLNDSSPKFHTVIKLGMLTQRL